MNSRLLLITLPIALLVTSAAYAKNNWRGPAGEACEFDLNGKHYKGVQYPTGTQTIGSDSKPVQGWGCNAAHLIKAKDPVKTKEAVKTNEPVQQPKHQSGLRQHPKSEQQPKPR